MPNPAPSRKPPHSRPASLTATPKPHLDINTGLESNAYLTDEETTTTANPSSKTHYTLFIRLPFRRGDFQDPPPISWDAARDRQLWKCISSGTSKDLNWEALSEKFDVPLTFLLQQAAWLYERHFEGMKKGMMKLGAGAGSGVASPVPDDGVESPRGGVGMERVGSRGMKIVPLKVLPFTNEEADSQRPSTQLPKKPPPLQTATDATKSPASPHPQHPGVSRTPSTTTVTQSRMFSARSSRRPSQTYSKGLPTTKVPDTSEAYPEEDDLDLGHDGTSESESEDESTNLQPFRRSPLSKRPAMRTLNSDNDAEDEDDDDDSGGGFLPFAARTGDEDGTATLINPPKQQPNTTTTGTPSSSKPPPKAQPQSDSASSQTSSTNQSQPQQKLDTLSPQQRAQLSRLSPRYRNANSNAVSGSDGSPSMGSSFSDLDDFSVTQSALEDALLSHVRAGGGTASMGMGSLVGRGRGGGG
jgi:hypothetical protein